MAAPKVLSKKFKAKMTGVKVKGELDVVGDTVEVEDAQIVLTLTIAATPTTLRMVDFFNGAKPTKNTPNKYVDVTVAGQQYALDIEGDD